MLIINAVEMQFKVEVLGARIFVIEFKNAINSIKVAHTTGWIKKYEGVDNSMTRILDLACVR